MKKPSLYSSSKRSGSSDSPFSGKKRYGDKPDPPETGAKKAPDDTVPDSGLRRFYQKYDKIVLVSFGVAMALFAILVYSLTVPEPFSLTQRDIDMAVLHSLENQVAEPSEESIAYEIIRPSIVRVRRVERVEVGESTGGDERSEQSGGEDAIPDSSGSNDSNEQGVIPDSLRNGDRLHEDIDRSVGTGVVIVDDGTILTNLHVISGSARTIVEFADGTESEADVVGVQPENDLAVIKARELPDDLVPATIRSTSGLRLGDHVVAVGYPFGIGPSVTSGVISGLGRQYVTASGEQVMSNLIQFDAAANPGNSGGPLITREGEVIGIVTAILNTSGQRTFIGIGFAVPIENAASGAGSSPF